MVALQSHGSGIAAPMRSRLLYLSTLLMKSSLSIACWMVWLCWSGFAVRADEIYFPPQSGEWETVEPAAVGWDAAGLQKALDYAQSQRSTGVVVLYRGRILAEGNWQPREKDSGLLNRLLQRGASERGVEDVASAQKSVTSFLVGVAQEKGLLSLDDSVSKYLGESWAEGKPEEVRAIKIRHLLEMTSGLNEQLKVQHPAGSKWQYNTAAYAKTVDVLEKAAGMDRRQLTEKWLTGPIGMTDSTWIARRTGAANSFGFATTARDLARFGLLVAAEGHWGTQVVLADQKYLAAATHSSQRLNPFYGYLWWVNNDAFSAAARLQTPTAPADMFSAKGALGRRCYVVPSLDLVVTRLGNNPGNAAQFDARFWELLMAAAPKK
ncbi:serine hydrolase domain-containing protein [Blastopirellula marina]|uniref:Serine hydrolase n=1 Tax=Blastopirellula marina TaxID=124 RepID=A0A2S8F322_9BACT|nr:serine hydrolase [Blastopirellula marina]PQO26565.1 serine hydrolase [Blastopirellula marina]PTL40876.1 serine hydrolase [Blastopirellula marina]